MKTEMKRKHQTNPMHLTIRCTSPSEWSDLTPEKWCSEHQAKLEPCEQNGYLGQNVIRCEANPGEQGRSVLALLYKSAGNIAIGKRGWSLKDDNTG